MRNLILAAATALAVVLAGSATAAFAQEKLRAVSAFPASNDLTGDFTRFIDMVNERGKGVLEITLMGGPEVTPVQEQGPALANGLFDMLFGPPSYYAGRFPEADVFSGPLRTAAEIRKDGGVPIYDEALASRVNAKLIAFAGGDVGLYIFTSKQPPIGANGLPDLSGMRLRSAPLYTALFEKLGATGIVLPFGEVYTSLERGLAEGLGWNLIGVRQAGWHEFLRYRIGPDMYRSSLVVTMNLDRYNGLSDEAKALLEEVALEYEDDLAAHYREKQAEELAALEAAGIETVELSAEGEAAFRDLAMETMWARVTGNSNITIDVDAARKIFYGR